MALKNIHTDQKTKTNIHAAGVAKFRTAIGPEAYQEISDWIFERFEESEWVNTSWTAPRTWEDTPLDAIWQYFRMTRDDDERHEESAKLYGCIFYTELFNSPHIYLYHRPEGHHSDDKRPFGLTYRRE